MQNTVSSTSSFVGRFATFFAAFVGIIGLSGQLIGEEIGVQSVGPHHPACLAAFRALPIDQAGRPIEHDASGAELRINEEDIAQHYTRHRDAYERYDRDCFFGWPQLKASRKFLEYNAGALFVEENFGEDPVPFCSAFRVAQNIIMTASHCLRIKPVYFRLFGDPTTSLEVYPLNEVELGSEKQDLTDFVLLKLEGKPVQFSWARGDFARETIDHQSIAIVAISIPAFYVAGTKSIDGWLGSVRFTRVYASQLWPISKVENAPKSATASTECLFHTASTFPGMSGAPIIAVRRIPGQVDKFRFYVIGMHLRNGLTTREGDERSSCGIHRKFNIGIRIPSSIVEGIPE